MTEIKGIEIIYISNPGERIVSMINFQDDVIIATTEKVMRFDGQTLEVLHPDDIDAEIRVRIKDRAKE